MCEVVGAGGIEHQCGRTSGTTELIEQVGHDRITVWADDRDRPTAIEPDPERHVVSQVALDGRGDRMRPVALRE